MDFSKLATDKRQHGLDILEALRDKNGLNYVQKKSTNNGRQHDHASFASSLISHLQKMEGEDAKAIELTEPTFFVTSDEDSKRENAVLLKKSFIELTLNANGKTDLYFHGYVQSQYINFLGDACQELSESTYTKKMTQLGAKLNQAIEKVQKYKFGKPEYEEYLTGFTTLKPSK